MKKKDIVTLALTAALLMTAHAVPVAAAESAAPNATSPTMPAQAISISGKQISVSAVIAPKKQTTKSKGTLYLEKKSGNSWSPVTSWPIDGTGTISLTKTYTGTTGVTYRTRVVVTTGADEIDATSTERTV